MAEQADNPVSLKFINEQALQLEQPGCTILDASLLHGIPHVYACGGNGRCSTCRVLVVDGEENLSAPNALEQKLAREKGFEHNVRLACQAVVKGDVSVRRLVLDKDDIELAVRQNSQTTGKQQKLAILFSDIRRFTPFVESNLPYDVVHILNRYFYLMGQAVIRNHGMIDKYMGDGLMALFGVDSHCPKQTCLNAVNAGLDMQKALSQLNSYLSRHFDHGFQIGVGIDFGDVLVGDLGHPQKQHFTAIGNAVNVASRIESKTKDFQASLLVSESVRKQVEGKANFGRTFTSQLKGTSKAQPLFEVLGLTQKACEQISNDQALWQTLMDTMSRVEAPMLLRLAYHDAASYDPSNDIGGADGSIRLEQELARPENKGLELAIAWLQPIKEKHHKTSWADLIAVAGAAAVAITDGPIINVLTGRKDSDKPAPENTLADYSMGIDALLGHFAGMGFNAQELVALSGGHTLGRAFSKPITGDLFVFNNSYYQALVAEPTPSGFNLVPSDIALLQHPETKKWVHHYALSEQDFFTDFANAWQKLTLVGTGLD